MIDFSEYTREYIQEQMLDQVDEDIDTREGSMVQTAVGPGAWFLEGLYMTLAQMQDNSYSQTAVGEYLDYITEGRGIVRKAATPAVRQGTFDAQIPENSIFQTLNGDNSVNFVSGDLISHVGSTYVYKLTCQEPGIIGNSYTGPILPVTAINNLTQASIGAIITVGSDEETDAFVIFGKMFLLSATKSTANHDDTANECLAAKEGRVFILQTVNVLHHLVHDALALGKPGIDLLSHLRSGGGQVHESNGLLIQLNDELLNGLAGKLGRILVLHRC